MAVAKVVVMVVAKVVVMVVAKVATVAPLAVAALPKLALTKLAGCCLLAALARDAWLLNRVYQAGPSMKVRLFLCS
jgi:hypothetical protein